ncbi:MAG: rod shape-determining protein MreD [Thermodesulfobacteriota bacterium]
MKRNGLLLLTGIVFLTVQTTLFFHLPVQRIRPDIVLILILHWGFTLPLVSGGIHALLLGYLMDLFSGNSFGLYTFTRPLLFSLAQLFRSRFYIDRFVSQFSFVFAFAVFEGLLIFALLFALNPSPLGNLYPLFITSFLPQSFLTAMITPVLFFLLKKFSFALSHRAGTDLGDGGRR